MASLSFGPEFLDPLLLGEKQQSSRPYTNRFHVGDLGQIYIQQRSPIATKPLRRLTPDGRAMISDRIQQNGYPCKTSFSSDLYYAHFLGTIRIAEVVDIHPIGMEDDYLEAWSADDGFSTFSEADKWFTDMYNDTWMDHWWTVVLWDDWVDRYFDAGEIE